MGLAHLACELLTVLPVAAVTHLLRAMGGQRFGEWAEWAVRKS